MIAASSNSDEAGGIMVIRKLLSIVLFAMLTACGYEGHSEEAETAEPPRQPLSIGASEASQTHTGTGKVTAIDRQSGKITITHDPIPSLGWSSMTMPFEIKDTSQLESVQKGDKVSFALAQGDNEQYVIQEIRRQ
jgi:Cu(I)/Ag(I) efflux system protein CusF